MTLKDIVNRIEELLQEKHLSMNELMNSADISTTIYQWRTNRSRDATRVPSLNSIIKICNYFGISLSYFFAENKAVERSVKQQEVINKLYELTDTELDVIAQVIETFLNNRAVLGNELSQQDDNKWTTSDGKD